MCWDSAEWIVIHNWSAGLRTDVTRDLSKLTGPGLEMNTVDPLQLISKLKQYQPLLNTFINVFKSGSYCLSFILVYITTRYEEHSVQTHLVPWKYSLCEYRRRWLAEACWVHLGALWLAEISYRVTS
jgi:hypothetical protein